MPKLTKKELKELGESLRLLMVLEQWKSKKVGSYLDGDSELENAPTLKKKIDTACDTIHKLRKKNEKN